MMVAISGHVVHVKNTALAVCVLRSGQEVCPLTQNEVCAGCLFHSSVTLKKKKKPTHTHTQSIAPCTAFRLRIYSPTWKVFRKSLSSPPMTMNKPEHFTETLKDFWGIVASGRHMWASATRQPPPKSFVNNASCMTFRNARQHRGVFTVPQSEKYDESGFGKKETYPCV